MRVYPLLVTFCFFAEFVAAQKISTPIYKQYQKDTLSLDVYEPEQDLSKVKRPVIILFHGGGLVSGNRDAMKKQCAFYAERGLVAVSPSYHLIPKKTKNTLSEVEQSIKDAKSAVRWVKQHAAEFGIDTNKLFLGGGSAGGFLATEVALNDSINQSSDDLKISTKARALILYNPAYTPETRYAPPPINYISKSTPPAIFFYGENDTFKPGGDKFYNKLAQENVTTELWVAKGEKHGFFNKEGWTEATSQKAYNFLLQLNLINKSKAVGVNANFVLNFQQPGKP